MRSAGNDDDSLMFSSRDTARRCREFHVRHRSCAGKIDAMPPVGAEMIDPLCVSAAGRPTSCVAVHCAVVHHRLGRHSGDPYPNIPITRLHARRIDVVGRVFSRRTDVHYGHVGTFCVSDNSDTTIRSNDRSNERVSERNDRSIDKHRIGWIAPAEWLGSVLNS